MAQAGKTVLFICTGNYYRSRFAEAVFNHLAHERRLPHRAVSRGLDLSRPVDRPIAIQAEEALLAQGVSLERTAQSPRALKTEDLAAADILVALDRQEHEQMIAQRFPDWLESVEFWDCQDLGFEPADRCLPNIQRRVEQLVKRLNGAGS